MAMIERKGFLGSSCALLVSLTAGLTLHWVNRDFFDQRTREGKRPEADHADFTGDLGMTFRF